MSIAVDSVQMGGSLQNLQSWKRKGSDEEDECAGPSLIKRSRYSYYFTLESESPVPTDDDEESVYSFQDRETEYVRDTSDTSSESWDDGSDAETYRIEYEVTSPRPEIPMFLDSESSSDPEDIIAVGVLAAICESDDLADNSDDSRSTVDSEIGKADYWTCVQCNTSNNNPLFRYCERCYKERKNFFPPRPKRRNRRNNEKIENSSSQLSVRSLGSAGSETVTPTSSQDLFTHDEEEDSHSFPVNMQSFESFTSTRSEIPSDKLCVVCATNPKNGVFVHGSIVHICCCYRCAVKVWKTNDKKCPLCQRKVSQVLKAYYN